MRDGRTVPLPSGVTEEQVRAAFTKRRTGEKLTSAEVAMLERVRQDARPRANGVRSPDASFGGRYIVFVKRPEGPEAVWIRTGLTDLDYSEVVDGLQASDSVLILPSASLVQSQRESQERVNRITGGGGLPGMQQQAATPQESVRPAPGTR
jgi:hypothetical protein